MMTHYSFEMIERVEYFEENSMSGREHYIRTILFDIFGNRRTSEVKFNEYSLAMAFMDEWRKDRNLHKIQLNQKQTDRLHRVCALIRRPAYITDEDYEQIRIIRNVLNQGYYTEYERGVLNYINNEWKK